MNLPHTAQVKQQIVAFTEKAVAQFLQQHPDLSFYAFCYDLNMAYGEINLSLNTEQAFAETLQNYQTHDPETYRQAEQQLLLKYNSGDWAYACFDTLYVWEQEIEAELKRFLHDDNDERLQVFLKELNDFFADCLAAFTQTPTYHAIPKTADFIAFSLDHDESPDVVLEQLQHA